MHLTATLADGTPFIIDEESPHVWDRVSTSANELFQTLETSYSLDNDALGVAADVCMKGLEKAGFRSQTMDGGSIGWFVDPYFTDRN